MIKHNMVHTRFYKIWCNIKRRCYGTSTINYSNYGGRGITVCDKWRDSFENFRDDMLDSYNLHVEEFGENQTTLDRIDVDGNYSPENCKWATNKEQRANQRYGKNSLKPFKATDINGILYISNNQTEFSKIHGLAQSNIQKCLCGERKNHKGWIFEYIDEIDILSKKELNKIERGQKFKAISPENIVYIESNKTKFCKKFGINRGGLTRCLSGKQEIYKGWKFYLIEN